MISYSQISDLMTAATVALAAGEYASARDNALAAQALASVLPDTTRQSGDGGKQELKWDRLAIDQFVGRVQKLLNSSVGVQKSKVQINRPADEGVMQVGIF